MSYFLSIIIPTLGRTTELDTLLKSILDANIKFSFEIIIVDQNSDSRLDEIIQKFNDILIIKHHKVEFRGLSKAKNYGAKTSIGKWLSFPDDDCQILSNTYTNAFNILEQTSADIVFGKCVDEYGLDSVILFKKTQYALEVNNMEGGFIEATAIIRREVMAHHNFDENMGVGCFHGAEEGFDWLYRVLTSAKYRAVYSPNLVYVHPQVIIDKGDKKSIKRVFSYRCGFAYLCKKHRFYFKYFKRLVLVVIVFMIYAIINKKKAKYYLTELCGLVSGWLIEV